MLRTLAIPPGIANVLNIRILLPTHECLAPAVGVQEDSSPVRPSYHEASAAAPGSLELPRGRPSPRLHRDRSD